MKSLKTILGVLSLVALVTWGIVHMVNEEVTATEEGFSKLPIKVPIVDFATNSYYELTGLLIPTSDGSIPASPDSYFSSRLTYGENVRPRIVEHNPPFNEYVLFRKPTSQEAGWVARGKKSPTSKEHPRFFVEIHVEKGHRPTVNTANHGKFGEW